MIAEATVYFAPNQWRFANLLAGEVLRDLRRKMKIRGDQWQIPCWKFLRNKTGRIIGVCYRIADTKSHVFEPWEIEPVYRATARVW